MGKEINVTSFSEMESTAQKLQSASEEYKQIAHQLMQKVQTMEHAWQGADNKVFVQKITGFTKELNQMAAQLQTDADTLKKQKENYVKRQEDNISQAGKLAN